LNPTTKYGLVRYVVLWVLFAAAYSAAFGFAVAMPAGMAVLDGAVFGVVCGIEGLILWNVLKYGAAGGAATGGQAEGLIRIGRGLQIAATGILFVSVAVGAEALALYLSTETLPAFAMAMFAATIPARCLTVAAVYACFVLWYSFVACSKNEENVAPAIEETETVRPAEEYLERITVKGAGGSIEVIGVEEIVYIQAEGDYVAIVTANGRRLKEGTMKYFEEMLPRGRFVRVHRSYIVAVDHISRIETSGRDHRLILRTGAGYKGEGTLRISDAGYALLKRTLGL
jgi:hypothetical protein